MTKNDLTDRELAMAAIEKKNRGNVPTAKERTALAKVTNAHKEKAKGDAYSSVSKKHLCKLTGRTWYQIKKFAETYNAPIGTGPNDETDLAVYLPWIHDFTARNQGRLQERRVDGAASLHDLTRLKQVVLAEITDIPKKTLNAWRQQDGMPRNSDGTYIAKISIPWILNHFRNPKIEKDSIKDKQEKLKYKRDLFAFEKEQQLYITKTRARELLSRAMFEMLELFRQLLSCFPPVMAEKLEKSTLARMSHQFEEMNQGKVKAVDKFEA